LSDPSTRVDPTSAVEIASGLVSMVLMDGDQGRRALLAPRRDIIGRTRPRPKCRPGRHARTSTSIIRAAKSKVT
jgi:hypothetical protein